MPLKGPGFALYVHWPFCLSKCPYCDFNSHVTKDIVDQQAWQNALLSELDHFASETGDRILTSVFFGGGTPSLMPPETVAAILDRAGSIWSLDSALEVTLEANPTSIEMARFRDFKAAGVSRVSVGIQSLSENTLKFLGREHSAREARKALGIARDTFEHFSFDLIYALAGQTPDSWQKELSEALELTGEHLSLYQLTIETGTPFYRNGTDVLEDDQAADMFELTQAIMDRAGYPAYEVSNHARPGHECRHNMTYWRGGDYMGIGPGAHGRLTTDRSTAAIHQIHSPTRWLEAVKSAGHGTAKRRILTPVERAEERIMMGLRLHDGLYLSDLSSQTGISASQLINPQGLQRMTEGGFVELDNNNLKAVGAGKLCLNSVIAQLLK